MQAYFINLYLGVCHKHIVKVGLNFSMLILWGSFT